MATAALPDRSAIGAAVEARWRSLKSLSKRAEILIAVALSFIAFVPSLVYAFGDEVALASRGILLEDSFYYLTIARRFVAGEGLTLDGTQATNGFHPLFLALLIPGALCTDEWGFVRYVVGLGGVIHAASSIAIYHVGRVTLGRGAAILAGGFWAAAMPIRLHHVNGLETGLSILCFLIAVLVYLRIRQPGHPAGPRQYVLLGVALGVCYLARTDAVFLGAAIALDVLWQQRRGARVPLSYVFLGGALTVAPWLVGSYLTTGAVFPDSGTASRFLGIHSSAGWYAYTQTPLRPEFAADALGELTRVRITNLGAFQAAAGTWSAVGSWTMGLTHPEIFRHEGTKVLPSLLFASDITLVLGTILIVSATVYWARRYGLCFFAVAALLLSITYAVLPTPPWFAPRYMITLGALWTLLVAAGLWSLLRGGRVRRALASTLLAGWIAITALQTYNLYPTAVEPSGYLLEAFWMRDNLPEDASVATFQTGTVSYFSHRRTVNLDGVVNREALTALQENRFGEFLRESDVQYVADWAHQLDRFLFPHLGTGLDRSHFRQIREGWFRYYRVTPQVREN